VKPQSRKIGTKAKSTRKHSLHGPTFTPEQERWRKDAYNRARYGSDSQSPLFWILENLHANDMHTHYCLAEKKIRISSPAADYINALLEEWKRNQEWDELSTDLEWLPASLFFDLATIAVRRRDAAFFEEVARILREKIVPRQEDMAGRHVLVAYEEVKQPGSEPTKKEVRERALRKWATQRVILRRVKTTGRPWNGNMPTEREVLAEQERLPRQDWTEVFRRCGLGDLPSDKGGRPSHKRHRVYP